MDWEASLAQARGGVESLLGLELIEHPHLLASVPVSVVLTTHNDSATLPEVIARVPDGVQELVVVDRHSEDGSATRARQLWPGASVLELGVEERGVALAAGLRSSTGEIVVTLAADGSSDPGEIPRFVAALLTGADFAKGTRFVAGGGSTHLTPARRLGHLALSGAFNRLWPVHYSDVCYGYVAFWRRHVPDLVPDRSGAEGALLVNIRAVKARLRIVEVPSFERGWIQRPSQPAALEVGRVGLRLLRTIVAERVRP